MSSPATDSPAAPAVPEPRRLHLVLPQLVDSVRSTLIVVVVALFILAFLVQPFRIPSESMEHTLLVGDFLLVDKVELAPAGRWSWLVPYRRVARGDIIVFHFPLNPEEHIVKRVVAIPGDAVAVRDGHAVINTAPLREPYAVFEPADRDQYRDQFPRYATSDPAVDPHWRTQMAGLIDNGHLHVPEGDYFAMGDNRNHSRDSRYWGFVPYPEIEGTPLFIYFSLRAPSATDTAALPNGRLGNSIVDRFVDFARWDRILRVVR